MSYFYKVDACTYITDLQLLLENVSMDYKIFDTMYQLPNGTEFYRSMPLKLEILLLHKMKRYYCQFLFTFIKIIPRAAEICEILQRVFYSRTSSTNSCD